MADQFESFETLAEVMVEGRDYQIVRNFPDGSLAAIVAPHGGKIEPHTSELARMIAEQCFAFYAFEGMLPSGNRNLHVTSHNFDEPIALDLVARVDVVVGIHGMQDRTDGVNVCLGGLDTDLIELLSDELEGVGINSMKTGHDFPARHPSNICNRGRSATGAQLEISSSMRKGLFRPAGKTERATFADCVRRAVFSRIG